MHTLGVAAETVQDRSARARTLKDIIMKYMLNSEVQLKEVATSKVIERAK